MVRLFQTLDTLIEYLVAAIFVAILLVGGIQVFGRYVMNFTPAWSSEAQIFGHIFIVFLAIPIAYRRGAHLYMDTLRKRFPRRIGVVFNWSVEFVWLVFGGVLVVYGVKIMEVTSFQSTPGLGIPMSYPYAALPLSGIYLIVMVLRQLFGDTVPPSKVEEH